MGRPVHPGVLGAGGSRTAYHFEEPLEVTSGEIFVGIPEIDEYPNPLCWGGCYSDQSMRTS